MNPIFNQNVFLVKEQIGMFKASNNFDIFNPENNNSCNFGRCSVWLCTAFFIISTFNGFTI